MNKDKKIVIFGDSAFGEIAFEYFQHDSPYEVAAFTVEEKFMTKSSLFGLPVIPFSEISKHYPPEKAEMHIALVYTQLNRVRMRIYAEAKQLGYRMGNYISSRAFVWRNVVLGDNCFVFEDNTIQPFVRIGSNNVFWSGNHIGHHSVIGSHNFISSHVVVSGFCEIGDACFFGVNSTLANNVVIGSDCLIGAGSLIVKSIPEKSLIKGNPSTINSVDTHKKFGIEE